MTEASSEIPTPQMLEKKSPIPGVGPEAAGADVTKETIEAIIQKLGGVIKPK